ncbi:MAG: hypothetical protein JSV78_12915 [Phycisphaerales bacterium]|nr:MAG: hypothetical protein JSV78_12915 [Phycisphaerales bacterium]
MNQQPSIEELTARCEEARLAVGRVINENRIDPDMEKIDAALARWQEAKTSLRKARGDESDDRPVSDC